MKNTRMGSKGFGRFVVVLGTLSLGLLVTGCDEDTVPVDAGTDAGMDAGTDAGTDAGVACTDLPHDPKLGTLQLQTGFAAAETAALPEGIGSVTAIQSGPEFKLYGLRGTDLYELGTWPNVALGTAALQSTIAEPDRAGTTYPNGYLTNDGTRVLSGYTKPGPLTNTPGMVLVYDTRTPANSQYVSAPGNFTAAGLSGSFLINGQGIEGSNESGNAVYALKTETSPFQGSRFATFPESGLYSGYTAVATNGVAVLGYSDSAFTNHLRAMAPALYTPALSGGTTLALSDSNAPEIYSGDLAEITAFGEGVALHRTNFPNTRDVSRIALTVGGTDAKVVTAGTLESVLTTSNTCTNVVTMSPLGADLLVGVKDKNGRRLVRLQVQP
ncbi:MAG TPA: hypothetical protein VF794_30135 [Archangium sp.]|jgi:hypothetical protein|uniref:hypothetical protein n=1 Tax=Archangium sp. TaxID=1872627 RepID=UPI002EDAD434